MAGIDYTKGILVVCMVIYHSLNYSTRYELGFQYLAFLPPSFIVITGFLLSSIYPMKESVTNWRLHRRLVSRGVKLLVLFTALNVLIQVTVARNVVLGATPGLSVWWSFWFETYISGEGRTASFEVLLPIAYLLLLAPVLLFLDRCHWLVLPIISVCTVGALAWPASASDRLFNVQLMSAGLVGMLLGRVPFSTLDRLPRFGIALGLCYVVYFAIGRLNGQSYLLQLAGAVLALALIYSVCARLRPESLGGRCLERLGRYSLIAYIGQIGILQIVVRAIGRPEPDSPLFLVILIGTLLLTVVGVELVDLARRRSVAVGGVYNVVFA